jgi:CRP/FNR family transcriptional regulator
MHQPPQDGNGIGAERRIVSRSFSKGTLLFIEGDRADGVFILRRGRVKFSIDSAAGRSIILGIAGPGDIVGLSAAVAGTEYEATAVAIDDGEAHLVARADLVGHLTENPDVAFRALRQLSGSYIHACEMLSSLTSADPVLIRLAKLFVSWMPAGNGHHPVQLENDYTHQQIAEMIGTTRETVTRALSEMRQRGLATLKNDQLVIHDGERLRVMTGRCVTALTDPDRTAA